MPGATRIRYSIVFLALVVNLISYTDRACVSIAGPKMRDEFGFSPTQMGLVYSIFSLSYFLGQTPWGLFADRYGARRLVAAAIVGWSLFTALTATAWSFASLIAIRFVFGALEASLSPAIAAAFNRWIPVAERSSAFGFFLGGGRFGGAITPMIAAGILTAFGWRAVFLSFAGLGVLSAIAWFAWFRDSPAQHRFVNAAEREHIQAHVAPPRESAPKTEWARILRSPRLWALLSVAFGSTFLWQFYITWFPTYLMENRGLPLNEAARYASLPFLFGVFATWLGGLATDFLSHRSDPRTARTIIGVVSLGSASVLLSAGLWISEPRLAAFLMASAAFGIDIYLGAAWTSALDIGGRNGGAVAGLMNAASNCAGFVSPTFNGWVLQTWHDWNIFLTLAVVINAVAAVIWIFVNPRPSQGTDRTEVRPAV